MFYGDSKTTYSGPSAYIYIKGKLKSLDLSNFDTSKVTSMISMFENQCELTSLDLSSFDTSNVTNMANMFEDTGNIEFLDLSSFDTRNVTETYDMFGFDKTTSGYEPRYFYYNGEENRTNKLRTIYVSNLWDISQVDPGSSCTTCGSTNMFRNCDNLVGGNGTIYDSSIVDKTFAVIDTPSTPGYLTLKQ